MAKLLFNSTISTPGAKFYGIDIKSIYLDTPLDRFEYMQLPLDLIPAEINSKYNLDQIVDSGWIYIEIQKGMYELPQVGVLTNKLLTQWLATRGFYRGYGNMSGNQFPLFLWLMTLESNILDCSMRSIS